MSNDLATLETQRSQLLEEFLGLGDLRPGSITAVTRRCGKPYTIGLKAKWRCARSSRRWLSFTASRSSARIWSPSTKRFVDSARSRRNAAAGRNRKKNGCYDP